MFSFLSILSFVFLDFGEFTGISWLHFVGFKVGYLNWHCLKFLRYLVENLGVWIRRTCWIFKSLFKTGRGELRLILSGVGEMMVCS